MLQNWLKGEEIGRHMFGAWHTFWLDCLWAGISHKRTREVTARCNDRHE